MDILSIGNSYSQDAQRYLHQIARAGGEKINAFNLYIGGCPLSLHYRNMLGDENAYMLQVNGSVTGFKVSIREALLNRDWDVVTLQQASTRSYNYDTYQPYLNELYKYVKLCCPKAKVAIHQTWAYEQDSPRLNNVAGYTDHKKMFKDIKDSYAKAEKDIDADFIIPSGEVLQKLIENGIEKVHRDTYHASLGLGRYAIGLTWYRILTGGDVEGNTFCDFDEEVTKEEMKIAKKSVIEVCKSYGK